MTLTVPEAARRVGRDPSTVRRWIRQGRLKATRVGTHHVVEAEDLDELVDVVELPGLPEWETTADGSPMPNVVAALRRTRAGH
jgi:excisionase family DNA binding protein